MNQKPKAISTVIPYFCLFISGTASLVYELIWIRQLTQVFGGTLYAISAVLCAFMAGLGLGAWGIAGYLSRREQSGRPINLIRLYGILEGLIGLYGLAFPQILKLLERIYPLAMGWSVESGPLLHWIEFGLSAFLLLLPTLLMGATLPIIGSWAIGGKADKVLSNVSLLYSLNTFGAVFGCLYTQWFAVKYLGVTGATLSAVMMNALVFFLCFFYRAETTPEKPEKTPAFAQEAALDSGKKSDPVPSRFMSLLLLSVFVFSGMASLSGEILWTRVLVFPLGSTLYSFALILGTFLFSIAVGSLIAERVLGNSRLILKFLLIELSIGVICIGILPLFNKFPEWTALADQLFYSVENTPGQTLMVRSLFAFGLMFLPSLGFGLIYPLANRIHLPLFGSISRTLGNTYAINTLGAVLGTVLTPFVFIPLWGIRMSIFIIFSGLILLSCVALALHQGFRPVRLIVCLGAGIFLVFGGYTYSKPGISTEQLGKGNLARKEITDSKNRIRLMDYKEGNFSTISVVEDVDTQARTLYVDGFSTATASDSVGGSAYMQAMGFVPMALHPNPRQALVVGFGTGSTLGTVSLFPGVKVDGVEIDRNILSFAHWFARWNRNVLDRPNVRMVIQDGRTFTRWTDNRYDVITLEPMSPVQAGVVNLYSREFYELARNRLNPGGLMMQWLPLHLVGPADAKSIIKTFQEVFPHTSIWNSFLTRIVLLVGSAQPVRLDKRRFDDLMQNVAVEESARQIGIQSFLDFADFFITDGERLKSWVEGAGTITDDRPLLEFSPVTLLPPLKWETDESFLNMLRYRIDQSPPSAGISSAEESILRREFLIRTAQRLAVFSRRYHGPGEAAFAAGNHHAGLEAVRIYMDIKKDTPIRLKDARWQE